MSTLLDETEMLDEPWPQLIRSGWRDTADTLQLWVQVIGKARLTLMPLVNHSWHSTLYLSARGLTIGLMPFKDVDLEVEFDFVEHRLWIRLTQGQTRSLPLRPQSVATFYRDFLGTLESLGIHLHLHSV